MLTQFTRARVRVSIAQVSVCNVLFWEFNHKIEFERRKMHPA
jgi:hypothetical protein